MVKYLFIIFFSFNILNANENVVKTSELELFLFKIGFESLLKDVELTKDKSTLNEKEIKNINEKVELIMSELYKDKRVLLNDSNENTAKIDNKQLQELKKEISFLKSEIKKIKSEKKVVETNKKILHEDKNENSIEEKEIKQIKKLESNESIAKRKMRVATPFLAVYKTSNTNASVIRKIEHNTIIDVDYCKLGWCKLSGENYFVREYLIKPWLK